MHYVPLPPKFYHLSAILAEIEFIVLEFCFPLRSYPPRLVKDFCTLLYGDSKTT